MGGRTLPAQTFGAKSDRKLWRWSIYRLKDSWRHLKSRQRRSASGGSVKARRGTNRKMRLPVHQQTGQRELAAATCRVHGDTVRTALVAAGHVGLRAGATATGAAVRGDLARNRRNPSGSSRLTAARSGWHRGADIANGTATRHFLAARTCRGATGRSHLCRAATSAFWRT